MPRQSDFSPREDEIILRYEGQSSAITSAALESAGYQAQPARKLTARRNYLKKKALAEGVAAGLERSTIAHLEAERIGIEQRLESLTIEKQTLNDRLNNILTELQAEVARIGEQATGTAA